VLTRKDPPPPAPRPRVMSPPVMTLEEWEDEAISKIMLVTLDVLPRTISISNSKARKIKIGSRIYLSTDCPRRPD